LQQDFFDNLEVQLTEEEEKEAEALHAKAEPLYDFISNTLGINCGFYWEFTPGILHALTMGGEEITNTFNQLITHGVIFPIPQLSHKKYGRLFIVAESLKQAKKIRKKLYKLQHIFPTDRTQKTLDKP